MMDDRPDPDDLLKRVQQEEARQKRGKLKIFFGAAPGVGKTYAMLQAAREKAREGEDVLIGYVEPHVRPETQALVLGLELLPRQEVRYGGAKRTEFDVNAALARRPQWLIVDELGHTNLPIGESVIHAKRWQDVEELLKAGINVYTTLNVQHLESLNDIIGRITGVRVRETVPDTVFDNADEVELVDLPADDLIERLQEGKVYVPAQAKLATQNFFKKGNLIALRELALRRTADRVNEQMQDYRTEYAATGALGTAERFLVCVGPSPSSARLIRSTSRMAAKLKAQWMAVHLETQAEAGLRAADREQLARNLKLAEQLGGETVVLSATDPIDEVVRYAHRRNVTKIVVGKPYQPRWREFVGRPFVYELTRRSGEIDVYVISGDTDVQPARGGRPLPQAKIGIRYLWAFLVVLFCTAVSGLLWDVTPQNTVNSAMVYLLGIVASAVWFGRGPSTFAAVLSVAAFDFCFVEPYMTFNVSDVRYILTFAVMLTVGLVVSTLAARVNFQAESARQREQRTAALYALSKDLAALRTIDDIVTTSVRHIADAVDSDVLILLPDEQHRIAPTDGKNVALALSQQERGVAQWVLDHGERAGLGTETLAGVDGIYLPLQASAATVGVLRVRPHRMDLTRISDQIGMLDTFCSLMALAIERVQWARAAERARLEIETERLRNSLLSAVSHDLRTPLATIVGSSSALAEVGETLDSATRRELAEAIYDEANQLNRQVTNLLDMARLDSGSLEPHKEWQPIEEVVGAVLNRLSRPLEGRVVATHLDQDLPMVQIDANLIQQVLFNLLENAIKYSPADSPLEISAIAEADVMTISIADRGSGLRPGEEQRVFERFFRSGNSGQASGVGLGLTICRGIVELHSGKIWAENRPGGGLIVRFTLPLTGEPPVVNIEQEAASKV